LEKLIAPAEEFAPDGSGRRVEVVGQKGRLSYVPRFSLKLCAAVVAADAERALPLVLALHRKLSVSGTNSATLSPELWRAAGSPSRGKRQTILGHLRKIPDLVQIREHRTPISVYTLAKGRLWRELVTKLEEANDNDQ
jgi:hypothetical protein